ncbi:hypothetical protein PPL_06911 [Heterostelium album PN500]|uniref:F-box domain-containing protein n=1 Tax=Heterostelium pallidum (strain ATCC 26659 / Pp 5 / PN500) TaxID=670386 RepID=D3BDV8_HETP5|nr:hypothetical protein PPL_06911 [Heterostelium album PN500]EFA80089.1 hypothetical protein PPL_06911 [Heterostelium album PN500]|eukprot:XP_020432209.1 hypothetical protein PPL_06911 [Heterostelium album PN500]
MSKIVSNQNDNHLLVKLPFILLAKIIKELDDNLDIICFSLVCKRWFDNRHSYLSFNCKDLMQLNRDCLNNERDFTLNSYRDIFHRSLDHKSNCTLVITSNNEIQQAKSFLLCYDYILTIENDIPESIINIYFTTWEIDANFIEKLSQSNVYCINLTQSQHCPIESEFNSIRFPSNIKEIHLFCPFKPNLLPPELEKLEIQTFSFSFDVSLLPRSLKSLKFVGSQVSIDLEALPPFLEDLSYSIPNTEEPETKRYPSSLKVLDVTVFQVKDFQYLTALHTLNLCVNDSASVDFQCGIPESVTHLTISSAYSITIRRENLPPNLKYLKLRDKVTFDQYTFSQLEQLETLDISGLLTDIGTNFQPLPSKIKKLCLPNYFFKMTNCKILPRSLEYLDVGGAYLSIKGAPKDSLKTLCIGQYTDISHSRIPKSVETIDFKERHLMMPPDMWPPSVKSILVTSKSEGNNHLKFLNIPKSITSITIRQTQGLGMKFLVRRLSDQSFLLLGINEFFLKATFLNTKNYENYFYGK